MKNDIDHRIAMPYKTFDQSPKLRSVLVFGAALACTVILLVAQRLNLRSYDLRVPFNYSGDTMVMLMYIKGLVQEGWPATITHLSAPFSYPGAAFPMLTSTDWLLIKILSVFTSEPGLLLNGFWLLSLVLSAWAASYSAYQLGLSPALSFVSGLLYACLPYAFLRNVAHLNLVYYPVPLLCLLAVVIARRGTGMRNVKHAIIAGLLACVLQGFDYVYDSFFAAALFCMAALISFRKGEARQWRLPLIAVAVLTVSTTLNLLPGLLSWHTEGKPPEMGYKSPAEAEYYGAKLRRMLVPHPNNPIRPLAAYAQKDIAANFPNENENATVRLGLYGSLGLILMLFFLLRRSIGNQDMQPEGTISGLGLATLLFITVGGFGAVFNLLVAPDIRAYNRFSVFLAFFSIAMAGFWLTRVLETRKSFWRPITCLASIAFIALSLYDQLLDAQPLLHLQPGSIRQAQIDRTVAAAMERQFPDGSAVLELPFTGYPIMYNFNKMYSYDHVRPYLWTSHLKWSWPSFSIRHSTWQEEMKAREGRAFVEAAVLSGFSAIWIDRYAYQDNGKQIFSSLLTDDVHVVDVGNERYAVLDLRQVATRMHADLGELEFNRRSRELIGPRVLANWRKGFYDEERGPDGTSFRWAQRRATLELQNTATEPLHACVQFDVVAPTGEVEMNGRALQSKAPGNPTIHPVRMLIDIGPLGRETLHFDTDSDAVRAPADMRDLHFYVKAFHVRTMEAGKDRGTSCAVVMH